MGKTGRKRRARKKKGANHGKRPNAWRCPSWTTGISSSRTARFGSSLPFRLSCGG